MSEGDNLLRFNPFTLKKQKKKHISQISATQDLSFSPQLQKHTVYRKLVRFVSFIILQVMKG